MTKILALDLGLKTGFFNGEKGGTLYAPKTGRELFFYNNILDLLVCKLQGGKYDAIVYEQAAFQQGAAAYIWSGQCYTLNILAQSLKIPCVGIHSMTVKKSFVGNGKATKEEMIKKASALEGDIIDDNHADAIAVYYTYKKIQF